MKLFSPRGSLIDPVLPRLPIFFGKLYNTARDRRRQLRVKSRRVIRSKPMDDLEAFMELFRESFFEMSKHYTRLRATLRTITFDGDKEEYDSAIFIFNRNNI